MSCLKTSIVYFQEAEVELHVVDEEVGEELQEEVEEEEWKLILVLQEQVPTKKRPLEMTKAHILDVILPSMIYTQIIISIFAYWQNMKSILFINNLFDLFCFSWKLKPLIHMQLYTSIWNEILQFK